MKLYFDWQSYKYLPYERDLAIREVRSLFDQHPMLNKQNLFVEVSGDWKSQADKMTYFSSIRAEDGSYILPRQAILEASASTELQELLPDIHSLPKARRQSTRYSAHGIHEYRGKYNPQIVRAVGNILGLNKGVWVLDPFCGSGTTLLEAIHCSWNAVGIEINPLGVLIAQAKIAAMHVPMQDLYQYSFILQQRLNSYFKNTNFTEAFTQEQTRNIGLPELVESLPNLDYLRAWFTESVLVQLALILIEINRLPNHDVQIIFRVVLSNILRDVSLQDPEDLRIRRRKLQPANEPAIPLFLNHLKSQVATISRARVIHNESFYQHVLLGDARQATSLLDKQYPELLFDAAITSPPYATALPYIDTQRLSLALLGLISADQIRSTEKSLIGNREITPSERQQLARAIEQNEDNLPDECLDFCKQLSEAVDIVRDGFRRQNVPGLIYQYCRDMAKVFAQVHNLLKIDAPFVLVVGMNKTQLGGKNFIVDTPTLLTSLALSKGFVLQEKIMLDTYHRFDIHQNNSIRSETMLILRRS